jgi:nitrogen fixation/metabolism regulation signal transduction histidine kinase
VQKIKPRPEYSILNVRILILIYSLLCVLTFLFSRNFFINTLQNGELPDRLNFIVFFTIPVVLIIVFGISVFHLLMDFIFQRPGSKFNARLLVYFAVIVIFTVSPITLMTSAALNEIVRFWHSIESDASIRAANSFIADNYSLHLERFENILRQNNFNNIASQGAAQSAAQIKLPQDISSVQVFRMENDQWTEVSYSGDDQFKLPSPPSSEAGFVTRSLPRDQGTIRYIQRTPQNTLRIINYSLGVDFDTGKSVLDNQAERFETVDLLRKNMRSLLIYYYAAFFLPTLLMTAIIAISFTRRISNPIIELTEATGRVAEGDFSFQILSRRNDELGILIRSFNSMIQDLEKSREALVRNEKISVWQNMAQQLAHEIKNPLTPIKLSAERVLRRWQNSPEQIGEILESSMMAIIQETEGLSVLLNEFRTLSKPMELSNSLTELIEPVEEVINSYSGSYPKVNFNIDNIKKDIQIKIDKHRLSQILTNLVINAIDSMNGSGEIELRSDIVKKREVCYCRISVKDSGKGISEPEGRNIFTPYFTTKDSGTGLGLPIIERIVTDHGGTIWFDSAEGMGTTFYIDLPSVAG